ncbi:formin-binding protein 1-like isoform X2 [Erinaceus europaeus]|uniref:Formin-binding protein 1-like n=1 Tax=Erinaceus europaeus TaxID=9365 RepID=A0ABM3YAH8_ERIEU|nr:formin-binding protein 1-like isoform X2 [Erinaceus europaeus]
MASSSGNDDDLTIPRAAINKMIKETLPNVRVANDARELVVNCCTEFIHLISSEANEICNKSEKKTISPEHVIQALESLGFGSYISEVKEVLQECKTVALKRRKASSRLENLGIPEEELLRQQQELFAKDQFDSLDKHTQWGIDFLERYAKFVKERIEIEQNYAKQLRNLVKKYCPKRSSKDEEPRFTSCIAFFNILNELNDYAGQREVVAEEMAHRVYGELMRYAHDLKSERKMHLQEGRKAQQYLDMCWKQMDNSKKKFERECREAEKAQQCYERLDNDANATKADVEKAKQQLNLRTHMADENKNEYAAQLQNFNGEQHKHFYIVIPQIYKQLQEMDERRTIKLSECYRGFADSERKVIPIISKCLEGMILAAKSVDERRDSQMVVDSFKSGFEPPGDFPFEDYSQHIYRTISDGTISTSKQESGKMDAKTTVGKAKGKLWLFGKKPKGPALEDFSHLPPEQRRKKLQQRIDELNRELQKESDQKEALNKMKDVYEKNPQMGDPGSLQPKLAETMNNIDRLRMEIHKNEAWLSEVEGKTGVRGDRRHSSDINHLVTQGRESPEGSYTDDANQEVRGPPQQHGHHNEFDDEFEDDDPLPAIGHCKAIYPFDGHNEGTLAMKEGEVLYIIEEDKGDGWTRARRQNGEEGYVPTSYIDVTLEKNSKGS